MIGILMVACAAWGAEAPVLVDGMEAPSLYTPAQPELGHKWTGSVALDTADRKEGQGCLRFEVQSAKSGEESYPQWGRAFDPAKTNWTGYRALRYWVKVESHDPAVREKAMCIVVYNGDSPLQQFVRHTVPVGQWVQLTDSLVTYSRDRVRGIIVYLYETNPAVQDDYAWWVDGLELIPSEPGEMEFDGYLVEPAQRAVSRPAHRLATSDGLSLVVDGRGRVREVRDGTEAVYLAGREVQYLSGLMIRDHKENAGPRPIEGRLARVGKGLRQAQSFADGLSVTATAQPVGERLDFSVTVRDTRPADRPLTLYFALPLDADGWTWWDDIAASRPIQGPADFWHHPWYPLKPRWSGYPICCLGHDRSALSLSVPLSRARVHRFVYDPRLKLLYVAWDFCLTPAAAKQQQTAQFAFSLFRSDPAWGFRSALQRYYDFFPESFEKRVPKDGGWGCWGTYEGNPDIPDLGFLYHWGPDPRGGESMAASVRFDNEHGYLALPYIEWTNMHVSMEGYEQADNAKIVERVRYIADPGRKEPLPSWSYFFPYDDRLGPDRDAWMREVFQAYLKSLIFTREGELYGRADRNEFGILAAKYIPFNADPDIPGGAGEFFLTKWWPTIERYYEENGARLDGFGWDNFYVQGSAFDYRPEHFAYADGPLLFDPDTLEPVILKDMATYELQREVVSRLREKGRYLIANQGVVSMVPATLPLLDVFGYEWNVENTATYARCMARHKPVCSLPVAPAHYQEAFVRDHLLYGCWPGGYYSTREPEYVALMRKYVPVTRRLCAAGWEPVTLARTSSEGVQVERFGGGERELLFSLKNRGEADAQVELTVDPSLLPDGRCEATELVAATSLGEVSAEAPRLALTAPAGQVVVVAIGGEDTRRR